jgi:Plasmid pRiA4b ORF-3-like protein
VTGRRACPPENVGGPWGYAHFLVALEDPAHPEHSNFKGLVDDDFDPAAFSADAVTARLHKLAAHDTASPQDRPVEQLDLSSSRFAEVLTLFDSRARDRRGD